MQMQENVLSVQIEDTAIKNRIICYVQMFKTLTLLVWHVRSFIKHQWLVQPKPNTIFDDRIRSFALCANLNLSVKD